MNIVANFGGEVFERILQTTWQAAVLVGLILLVQRLLKDRLSPQWRYRLWLLLVIRLLMPVTPQTAFSVFNWIRWDTTRLGAPGVTEPAVVNARLSDGDQQNSRVDREETPAFSARSERPAMDGSPAPLAAVRTPVTELPPARPEVGSWKRVLLCGWGLGCALLAGRLWWLHWRFGRRLRRYVPVRDEHVRRLFDECRQALGIRKKVELIETEEIGTPALFGFWNKCLLLPDGTFERFTATEVRHIFLHELAHVRRRDLEVNWLTSLIQAVHWFNPVLWYAFGRMRGDRELATDALVLSLGNVSESIGYGETLLKVLASLNGRASLPGTVGIGESKARLKERLRTIARRGTLRPWRWLAVLSLATLAAVALTDAMQATQQAAVDHKPRDSAIAQSQNERPSSAGPKEGEKRFTLAIRDYETSAPLQDAAVQFVIDWYSATATTQQLRTDASGLASLVFELKDLKKFAYIASKTDYLTLRGEWDKQQIGLQSDRYEIKLSRGTEIGGLVVDDRGAPLAGAEIFFDRPMNMGLSSDGYVNSQTWSAPAGERLAITDASGRWRARCMWPNVQWAELRVRHRGYADAQYSTQTTKAMEEEGKGHSLQFQNLVSRQAKFVLTPGLTLIGRIFKPDGKPLPGASLRYADRMSENPFWESAMGQATVVADDAGAFHIDDLPAKHIFLAVQAPGFAPAVSEIDLDSEHRNVEIRLTDPQQLHGLLVSGDDQPVPGARVTFQDWGIWQGVRWSAVTDGNGRFEWSDAPSQKFQVLIEKDGFIPTRKTLAGGGDQRIQIDPALRLTGEVIDAKTREPIRQFRVVCADREEYLQYKRAESVVGINGNYALDLARLHADSWVYNYYFRFVFRVEADGYVPKVSRLFSSRDGDVGPMTYDLELTPAKMLAGTLLNAAGHPVSGAQLALRTPKARLRIAGKPQFEDLDKVPFPASGPEGKFELAVDPEATHLIAVHEQGFARVPLSNINDSASIRLERWGRVTGAVKWYDKPLTNEDVILQWREETEFVPGSIELVNMTTTSDSDGRFHFDFVPPGKCSLYRWIPKQQGSASGAPELIHAKAGETVVVDVGGKGRPVVGRFKVKNPYVPIEWQKDHYSVSTVMPSPPPELKTREDVAAWRKRPEIQAAYDRNRNYPVIFTEDGSFRIDEVVPAEYQFFMQIYDPTDPEAFAFSRYIAQFNGKFTVPDGPDANSLKPLDVGVFEVTLKPKFEPGQTPAPEFTATDLSGKELKLSDFRGKYVLLDFWATWCGPCVGEMPYLKKAYEKFGKSPDFVMLSLSLDKAAAEPRAFVEKNGLGWKQAHLGAWDKTQVPADYGVQGIPALFLISPDGKILATGIEGPALQATLQKYFSP